MKTVILASAILLSTAATTAVADSTFTCLPGSSPNGLGIKNLVLEASSEEPEAKMTLTYERGTLPVVSNMVTEFDSSRLDAIPTSEKDGDISLILLKNGGTWTANVKSATIDTFSILDCEEK